MTRFARAAGSKGSNDKSAEDATSWVEMKAQMLANNDVKSSGKIKSDIEADDDVPTAEEISSVWAELVSESNANKSKKTTNKKSMTKSSNDDTPDTDSLLVEKKKRKLVINSEANVNQNKKMKNNDDQPKNKLNQTECKGSQTKKRKKKNKLTEGLDNDNEQEPLLLKKNNYFPIEKKTKKTEKLREENVIQEPVAPKKKKKILETALHLETDLPDSKDTKKKKKKQTLPQLHQSNIEPPISLKKKENKNKIEEAPQNALTEKVGANGLIFADPKPKEKKRRKEELKPSEVLINGKPVQLAPFDGFVVQAEDAQRLKDLRQSMKVKGIPEVEREKAIKLERRRAEKALARLKKRVCFHCRGSGHNLSECPQVQDDQRATGICYKCGSTEHTHYQCRVTKTDDYRFAECFICKEQGHISKQCPDNPRGLYPRGGGCASCGDVTHLKKDCPKYLAEKEDDTVTIGTRNNRALEALDEDFQVQPTIAKNVSKKTKQHIKF